MNGRTNDSTNEPNKKSQKVSMKDSHMKETQENKYANVCLTDILLL